MAGFVKKKEKLWHDSKKIKKRYGEKIKKGIDKRFFQVYHPTRKGKGVFEKKFSEASFTL
jgi:hypothetical protein